LWSRQPLLATYTTTHSVDSARDAALAHSLWWQRLRPPFSPRPTQLPLSESRKGPRPRRPWATRCQIERTLSVSSSSSCDRPNHHVWVPAVHTLAPSNVVPFALAHTLSQFLSRRSPVHTQQWPHSTTNTLHTFLPFSLHRSYHNELPFNQTTRSCRAYAHTPTHAHAHTHSLWFGRSRCCWFVAPTRTTQMHSTPKRTPNRRAAGQPSKRCNTPGRLFVPTSSAMARVRRGGPRGEGETGVGEGKSEGNSSRTHSESLTELTVRLSVSKTAHRPRPCPCWPHHPTGKPLVLPQPTKGSQYGQAWVHDGQGYWQPNQSERTAEVAMVSVM
jgi:hypothetical protein